MITNLIKIALWKTSYVFEPLILQENFILAYNKDLKTFIFEKLYDSKVKLSKTEYCICAFIIHNYLKNYQTNLNKNEQQFIPKIYNWIQIMRETEKEVEKHNLKIAKIFENVIDLLGYSCLGLILLKIDVQNESNLFISVLQIPQ